MTHHYLLISAARISWFSPAEISWVGWTSSRHGCSRGSHFIPTRLKLFLPVFKFGCEWGQDIFAAIDGGEGELEIIIEAFPCFGRLADLLLRDAFKHNVGVTGGFRSPPHHRAQDILVDRRYAAGASAVDHLVELNLKGFPQASFNTTRSTMSPAMTSRSGAFLKLRQFPFSADSWLRPHFLSPLNSLSSKLPIHLHHCSSSPIFYLCVITTFFLRILSAYLTGHLLLPASSALLVEIIIGFLIILQYADCTFSFTSFFNFFEIPSPTARFLYCHLSIRRHCLKIQFFSSTRLSIFVHLAAFPSSSQRFYLSPFASPFVFLISWFVPSMFLIFWFFLLKTCHDYDLVFPCLFK